MNWIKLLGVGFFLFYGCASHAPFKAISDAHQAIAKATIIKADVYSPEDMRQATERIEKAEKLVFNFEYQKAHSLASEASAYAQLASARSQAKLSSEAVKEAEVNLVAIKDALQLIEQKLGMLPSFTPDLEVSQEHAQSENVSPLHSGN
jgi:hypothetical protein